MKAGDLVKIVAYASRYTPLGTMGIITKKLPKPYPHERYHQCYEVRFNNGYTCNHANFCLEVISEAKEGLE
jgi:hypothetical protein